MLMYLAELPRDTFFNFRILVLHVFLKAARTAFLNFAFAYVRSCGSAAPRSSKCASWQRESHHVVGSFFLPAVVNLPYGDPLHIAPSTMYACTAYASLRSV